MNKPSDKLCQDENFGRNYVFKEDFARQYGVEAAILIEHFRYSIGRHKKNGTHFYEGRYWVYDAVSNLTTLYPFWSSDQITRIIRNLIEKKVLVDGNFNKHKYDRTKWFAFQDEAKFVPVDKSVDSYVDNSQNPVDNLVDNYGIKNNPSADEKSAKEPFLPQKSSVSRRNGHLVKSPNGFGGITKPIPIYSSISYSEGETANNHNKGNFNNSRGNNSPNTVNNQLRSFAQIVGSSRPDKITSGYTPSYSVRKRLYELGYSDPEIEQGILKMITYHEKNPQQIKNADKCVLGWFKKSMEFKKNPCNKKSF